MIDKLTIVKSRLADGRTISDGDVHYLCAEIERLREALRTIIGIPMSMCLNASDLAQRQKDIAFEALGARHD